LVCSADTSCEERDRFSLYIDVPMNASSAGSFVCRAVFAMLTFASLMTLAWADDRQEYKPELDAYDKVSDRLRLFLLADTTKVESQESLKDELGAHLDITLKGILRERPRMADWARDRSIWLRVGYRQLRTWDGQREDVSEHRGLLELTMRHGLTNEFYLSHRIGFDYRDLSGKSSQRYRYRLDLERELAVAKTVVVPYARAEFSYDTRYSAWSRRSYQLGSEIDISKVWRIEPYYAIDLDSEPKEIRTDRVGLILKFYW
jgi:hypothetical protein